MATKSKETNSPVEETVIPENDKVKIKLPLTRHEKDDVYVGVNEKTYLIKRGVEVEVPRFVAEVLAESERALDAAMAYEAANQSFAE